MKISVNSKVENGRLSVNRAALSRAMQDFEGKEVTITIARKKKSRSNEQNRYYWSCVVCIVRDCLRDVGHRLTIEETHLLLRTKFLSAPLLLNDSGEFIEHIKSTTELSTIDFSNYISDICSWVYEMFNVNIPEPNTQIELFDGDVD